MTKTCMEKDCQFGGLVQEINDGQTVKVLCGVHSIMGYHQHFDIKPTLRHFLEYKRRLSLC
ncbi:hypothetical protein BBV17_28565 [Cytobacillus oceanisediminis]|uniref:Uncharacterized protein n=1 Tax=Cytobacillus oceanisediminis TaxID=665099 RepID=A0ABX3CJV4_9BACI|nr:hypothetical protein BBV17_28565 [Cytobacillus oceanisediminis]